MTVALLFLALASLGLIIKNNVGASTIITLLISISTAFILAEQITPVESQSTFVGMIGIYLTVNFLLGAFLAKPWMKYVISLVLLSIFYFLGNKEWMFGNYALDFSQANVLLLPLFGIIIMVFLEAKKFAVQKLFPELSMETLESVVVLIFVSVFTIFATFLGSWIAFLLMSIGVFAFNAFSDKNRNYITLSLISFALMGTLIQKYQLESIDLSIGKTIAGLLMGAGAMGMLILAQKVNKWLWSVVFALLGAGILVFILMLNNVHPAFGGIEGFVASFAGMAIIGLWSRNVYGLAFLIPTATVIGLTLYHDPFAVNTKESSPSEKVVAQIKTEASPLDAMGESWTGLAGEYAISNTSVISFQLGPKGGVTKGEITKIAGSVSIADALEKSTFNVDMEVKNLSTFNSMRDESLMTADYFDEPKYPKMTYVANAMEPKDDGYLLKGNFKMLKKSMPQAVFLKYVGEKDGKKHFVGKSSLNKTDYGMASSPQEGDVVDFEIELYLEGK